MDLQQRLNVQVFGDGATTMIFAHGFGCDQNMWRLVAPAFADRYRIILFDLAGSGRSAISAYDPEKYSALQGYADDLAAVVRAHAQGPVVFVGHSVSAMIGVLADLEAPDLIAAHIMISPSPCYINDGAYRGGFSRSDIDSLLDALDNNYLGWSSTMAPIIMGAPNEPDLAEELTNSFCRTAPEVAKQFARVTFLSDHRAELKSMTKPALILQCTDDLIAPLEVGQYMANVLPNSTLLFIDNVGHCPHLSAPAASIAAMEGFLASLGLIPDVV